VRRIRTGIAVKNPSGLPEMLGKAIDFGLSVAGRKIRGYDFLQNEN
jgi:hypothetical protein